MRRRLRAKLISSQLFLALFKRQIPGFSKLPDDPSLAAVTAVTGAVVGQSFGEVDGKGDGFAVARALERCFRGVWHCEQEEMCLW